MQWRDQAIILGKKQFGENNFLLEVFSKEHGRYKGIIKGGRARKYNSLLQLGNYIEASYKARLDEHLGVFTLEPLSYFSGHIMMSAFNLHYVQLIAIYLRQLPEREAYPILYSLFLTSLDFLGQKGHLGEFLARFELKLLEDIGFGLSLSKCAVTGTTEELTYVSPKSGNVVCKKVGEPWAKRLFILPPFLVDLHKRPNSYSDIIDALKLTGFFLLQQEWQKAHNIIIELRDKVVKNLLEE